MQGIRVYYFHILPDENKEFSKQTVESEQGFKREKIKGRGNCSKQYIYIFKFINMFILEWMMKFII